MPSNNSISKNKNPSMGGGGFVAANSYKQDRMSSKSCKKKKLMEIEFD